jgi:hypothetical protein
LPIIPALPTAAAQMIDLGFGRRGHPPSNTHPIAEIARIAEMLLGLNFRISRNFRF